MSMLSPRLQLKVAQKQILTPSLVQMVTLLQLNKLELREMISQELSENPILEEGLATEEDELTSQEIQGLLEKERVANPADQSLLDALHGGGEAGEAEESTRTAAGSDATDARAAGDEAESPKDADPFEEIDFGEFFNDYLDPGYRTSAPEQSEGPTFETFLSNPVNLGDHLRAQLSVEVLNEGLRAAAEAVIGNLDDNGYLGSSVEELAESEAIPLAVMEEGLRVVQLLDPSGVAARNLRECLLLQLADLAEEDSLAWRMVEDHIELLDGRHSKELCRALSASSEEIDAALELIRTLDPMPGARFCCSGAQPVEPEIFIFKDGDQWVIQTLDEGVPQLRLNRSYRYLLERSDSTDKNVRNYVKERYASALQLIKNIEQRKQTILKVCQCIVERQGEFFELGADYLRPMMIKEIAEEIGVHPSTVSRAVANKYAHTPQGTLELRFFFTEAVQGRAGNTTSLLAVKRLVKRIIDEEDPAKPLTDEQIMERLHEEGIEVTRRTVAKYREDLRIPSTHHRRVRK
ncbi:MAG: RNA polymerase factor sigma-54 [Bryobacterales bacterium]|nr:RNA polymerase factor sigma-54 [Bryobacterales bacterium]